MGEIWRKRDGEVLNMRTVYDKVFVYVFLLRFWICYIRNWLHIVVEMRKDVLFFTFEIPLSTSWFWSALQTLLFVFTPGVRVKVRKKKKRRKRMRFHCCQRRRWTSWEPNWWRQRSWATRWVGYHYVAVSQNDLQWRLPSGQKLLQVKLCKINTFQTD